METFSALLALCAGNSPVTGEFPAQRPVTRSFDVFFDPRLNKRLSKQSWGWWFETPSRSLWRHCNEFLGVDKALLQISEADGSMSGRYRTDCTDLKLVLGPASALCLTVFISDCFTSGINYGLNCLHSNVFYPTVLYPCSASVIRKYMCIEMRQVLLYCWSRLVSLHMHCPANLHADLHKERRLSDTDKSMSVGKCDQFILI